ncbi:ABC transporter substrate-binding protein [Streptomyces sp. MAR4 CNX-425]|uniref:ABC transporter substrate-binding protein n=1 Tax=Streptomyces sp. MAR4 CNX-425 TaxID=3406343 RepID=UPI003B512DB3
MRTWTRRSRTSALLAGTLAMGVLAGCATDASGPGKPDRKITVWSEESLTDRIAHTRKVIDGFEEETGVEVELVGVDENQLPQLIMSAAAAGDLPDVIGAVPLGQTWQMYSNELLNTRIPAEVVDRLGEDTFDANGLRLTADGGTRLGVPSDAWVQIVAYREDLFREAGLDVPDDYASLLKAAERLDVQGRDGISVATDPADVFTQQSFEDLALANGCDLVDGAGDIALDSEKCRTAFETYGALARDHGPPGLQTVDTTRATYFAGRSSMIIWSSFLLDELAGLRNDALPSCPACTDDPGFLAANSGIVTALKGPGGAEPAQFGEITSWLATKTAETEASTQFIEYMMSAGYEDWFGMAPEGKIPVRTGTPGRPGRYVDAWRASDMGVDTRKSMEEVFSPELLDQLVAGVGDMKRWGIDQGEGALVGATNGELPVAKAVGALTSGQTSPEEAAREAYEEVDALKTSLE